MTAPMPYYCRRCSYILGYKGYMDPPSPPLCEDCLSEERAAESFDEALARAKLWRHKLSERQSSSDGDVIKTLLGHLDDALKFREASSRSHPQAPAVDKALDLIRNRLLRSAPRPIGRVPIRALLDLEDCLQVAFAVLESRDEADAVVSAFYRNRRLWPELHHPRSIGFAGLGGYF